MNMKKLIIVLGLLSTGFSHSICAQVTPDLMKTIQSTMISPLPLQVDDKLVKAIKSSKARPLNTRQIRSLKLSAKKTHGNQFKYYLSKRLRLGKNFENILVIQYYREETYIWLLTINKAGKVIDSVQVYYDNSEGNVWASSVIHAKKVIVSEGNIFTSNGKSRNLTYSIKPNGKFNK
jgi:hypothetical protein